jgi:serine/threonine protein kinase
VDGDVSAPVAGDRPILASRYRLERPLEGGAMAEVFAATDLLLGRSVAVKRLFTGPSDPATRQRFRREARTMALVNHPNVVAVYDAGEDDERPFLVMELVEGTTLRRVLDREGRIDPARATAIAADVAAGLGAAHHRGVVHRDVKPSNVFLTRSGLAKIGDFGIARVTSDPSITLTGEMFGSAPYVAPERITGGAIDPRSDLYSLGCVLFEMVTGRPPFEGEDPVSLTYRHVHDTPPDASADGIPPELSLLIGRLLSKDPADRPQTAHELALAVSTVSLPDRGPIEGRVDVPTAVIPPIPKVPTIPLPPGDRGSRPPRRTPRHATPRLRRWLVPIAATAVLLVAGTQVPALLRGLDSPDPAGGTGTSTAGGPGKGRDSPSPSAGPVLDHTLPSDPELAAGQLSDLLLDLQGQDAIDEHLVGEMQRTVDDTLGELTEHGDAEKALEKLADLRERVGEALDRGEVSPDAARQIEQAIGLLQVAIDRATPSSESDGEAG